MANKITVSAPGKVMLLGEHAVVYDRPCLVTAIGQRLTITAQRLDVPVFRLEARDVNVGRYEKKITDLNKSEIPKEARFVEAAVNNFFEKYGVSGGIELKSVSQISSKIGLGSSSAAIVCTIKALSELFDAGLDNREIFDLSFKTILDVQEKGSGFDVAAAIYGGTLYFVTGGKIIDPVTDSLPLVVGYSGVKSDTAAMIDLVARKAKEYPAVVSDIYDEIAKIVELGKVALQNKNWEVLGDLMNFDQGYLSALGVGTKKLSDMIYAAVDAGAWGAKLSGAGGGDCIIALASDDKRQAIEKAIQKAGGEIIKVNTDAPGVRVEQ